MCIRDSACRDWGESAPLAPDAPDGVDEREGALEDGPLVVCLLYTSDAADERSSVDLGGRRILKKKKDELQARAPGTRNQITNRTTHDKRSR